MQSAAYDLSIYEPKPKRQAEQSPRVRVVAQHSREELARPKMLAKAVGLVALLTVSLCMLLYSNAMLTELSDQVAAAQQKQQMLLAENLINRAWTHTHRQRRTRRRTGRTRTRHRGARGGWLLGGRTNQAHAVAVVGQLKIKEGISHSLTLSFHNLEAGTGCGYTAADLARGVTPHGFSIG